MTNYSGEVMELHSSRLILTPCTDKSLSTYNTTEYNIRPHIAKYLEELKIDNTLLGWGVWLVIHKNTERVIGDIGFKGKPDLENSIEVGYAISTPEQNKGYATESLKCLIEWAFDTKLVEKVKAECEEDNLASISVLKKLDMENTGLDNGMLYWEKKKIIRR